MNSPSVTAKLAPSSATTLPARLAHTLPTSRTSSIRLLDCIRAPVPSEHTTFQESESSIHQESDDADDRHRRERLVAAKEVCGIHGEIADASLGVDEFGRED